MVRLAVPLLALVAACDFDLEPTGEPESSTTPTSVAAATMPQGAQEIAWTRLFGSEDELFFYEVSDGQAATEYCFRYVGALQSKAGCRRLAGPGPPTVVVHPAARGWFAIAIDAEGRIDRFEVLSQGCRWANGGYEEGHLSWLWFPQASDRLVLLDADGKPIVGEPLPPGVPMPADPDCNAL